MKVGAMIFATDQTIPLHELAPEVEARGFELGIGYGWNVGELATHGVGLATAPDVLADRLALMQALWTQDIAGYEGPHASVEQSWSWPKPVQQPRLPIHLGGRASDRLFADIVSYGDGWLPIEGYGSVLPHIGRLRDALDAADRDPAGAIVGVFSSAGDPRTVESYAAAGVQRVVVWLPPEDGSTVLAALDAHQVALASWLEAGARPPLRS